MLINVKGEISVEAAPKVYLQNRLNRCRTKVQELEPVLTSKRTYEPSAHLSTTLNLKLYTTLL